MHNIDALYFFIFVFTILVSLKNVTKFISALTQREPKPLTYSVRELIFLGLSIVGVDGVFVFIFDSTIFCISPTVVAVTT